MEIRNSVTKSLSPCVEERFKTNRNEIGEKMKTGEVTGVAYMSFRVTGGERAEKRHVVV